MTRRLRQHNRHFSVEWLGNHQVALTTDEQWLVDSASPVGTCREVILHGDHGPAVLGWTLFADGARQGSGIAELGEQPLGERVFGHEPARRDHLQLARFDIAANPGALPPLSGGVVPVCFWGSGHCWCTSCFCPLSSVTRSWSESVNQGAGTGVHAVGPRR